MVMRRYDPKEEMLLPKKLTAENGAKYALIGEFFEDYYYIDPDDKDGEIKTGKVVVQWDTIKRIWDRAVAHFEALDKQNSESMVPPSEVTVNEDREPKA
jgi:hypothetical protein